MYNKRGQGLSTNAIILIVLGVVILAVLVIGFTMGWGQIAPFLSRDNVDTVQRNCETACITNDNYGFCIVERTLRAGDSTDTETCYEFSTNPSFEPYGISECPNIICPALDQVDQVDEVDEDDD